MNKKAKIIKIQKILDRLYPDPKPPLNYRDNYTFLIAVLLSAQCTDARVNKTTPLLFQKADTPEKMANLRPGEAFVWSSKATDEVFSQGAIKVRCRPRATSHGGTTKTAVRDQDDS